MPKLASSFYMFFIYLSHTQKQIYIKIIILKAIKIHFDSDL